MEDFLITIIVNSETSSLPLLLSFFFSHSGPYRTSHVCWHVPTLSGCSAKDFSLQAASFPPQNTLCPPGCSLHTQRNFLMSVPQAVRPSCSAQKAVSHHLYHMQDKRSNLQIYSSPVRTGTVSSQCFQNLTLHFTALHVSL